MYAYLSKDGLYVDRKLNLILIKMEFDKVAVEDLIVVNKDSIVFDKLDINKEFILISPKYHTCINKDMELVKITPDHMSSTFLDYIKNNTDNHIQHLVLTMVGRIESSKIKPVEQKPVCQDESYPLVKHNIKMTREIKDIINSISGIFMTDIIDHLYSVDSNPYDKDGELSYYLNFYQVSYSTVRKMINDYLNTFGFYIHRDVINEHVVIIKDLEKSFNSRTSRPITIYAPDKLLGLAIGPKGKNVNILKDKLNSFNTNWVIPYISVKNIVERPTNNDISKIIDTYLKLITNMLKIRLYKKDKDTYDRDK